jgi:hypothetical protein
VLAREVGQIRDVLKKEGGPTTEIEVYPSVRAAVDALRTDTAEPEPSSQGVLA